MIETLVITIAANYVVFTLSMFSMYCNHSVKLGELHRKHIAEFELQKAEAIIREDAVNLAREIDNLTKKDVPKTAAEMYEFVKDVAGKTKAKKIEVVGFENRGKIFAFTTSCYSHTDLHKERRVISIEEFCNSTVLRKQPKDGGLSVETLAQPYRTF